MPSPEERSREKIDKLLTKCGWILQNRRTINFYASRELIRIKFNFVCIAHGLYSEDSGGWLGAWLFDSISD